MARDIDYLLFENIYSGYDKSIHDYRVWQSSGNTVIKCRGSLNLAKKACEEFANLIYGENVKFLTDNVILESFINDSFRNEYRNFYERVMATGQGIQLPFMRKNGMLGFNRYTGDQIKSTEFTGGKLTRAVIEVDFRINIECDTINNVTKVTYEKLENSDSDETLEDAYSFNGVIGYHKPNIANNFDNTSQGISIFANSISTISAIDTIAHDMVMEYILGRKKVYVNSKALKTEQMEENGKISITHNFDMQETIFQMFDNEEATDFIKESDFKLRIAEYVDGLDKQVAIFSNQVGLGDSIRFDKTNSKVYKNETDVISANSDIFRNKVNHQNLDRQELMKDFYAFMALTGIDVSDLEIIYDDSIISDDEAKRKVAINEIENHVRSRLSYLMEYRHLTEEEARAELKLIDEDIAKNSVISSDFVIAE